MGATTKEGQHFSSMGAIPWLAKNLAVQHNDRVGSQHKISPQTRSHGERLHLRISENKAAWWQPARNLLNLGGADDHIETR